MHGLFRRLSLLERCLKMKKLLLIFCLFSSLFAYTDDEDFPASLDTIQSTLNEIADGYLATIYSHSFETQNYLYSFSESFSSQSENVSQITYLLVEEYYNMILDLIDKSSSLDTNLQIFNTNFESYSNFVHDRLLEITDGYLSTIYSKMYDIDDKLLAIIKEIEGNEDRENTNASNIQSIKDTLENFAPSFDSMVSSLANIESNTSYGDINYNNEDLINYLNDNHFDDFYTTFHGYNDAFVPTYLGYMSWSSFSISGNKDRDILRSWRPEAITYDNFFIQVCQYLDNLANMSANANKSLMMIYDSIETVETNELVEAMERKITEIEAQQSALEEAFSAFHELEDNISFEKFEEFLKTGSEGKVNLGSILLPGQFNDELDLGFFPTEWNNRPINVGNIYVRLGVLHEYLLVCRDIFAVVYIFLITIFILWIVRKMLPILSKLFTTLNSIVVWK